MNEKEKIQEIIKKYMDESKQLNQQIVEIERQRCKLAEKRNKKKNSNIGDCAEEVNLLGNKISELGNQSQELQNKLDSKFNEAKREVFSMIDNLIAEGIRKIYKIEEEIQELEDRIELQKGRKAKYERQKQEFYKKFGRVPELSANALKEDEAQDKQVIVYQEKIQKLENNIAEIQEELTNFANIKIDFKNGVNIVEIEDEIVSNEDFKTIEEFCVEEFNSIDEVNIEDFQVEELEPIEEFIVEPFDESVITNTENVDFVQEKQIGTYDEKIENIARAIVEEIVKEQTADVNINKIQEQNEDDIITFEAKKEDEETPQIDANVVLEEIIAKMENGEIVYKAQISNGEDIKIYPTRESTGNILLNELQKRKKIKYTLIEYAFSEHKVLDEKVINKLDPIICKVLVEFAKKYNYNAQKLIYNYAMTYSKNIENITEENPKITYNLSNFKNSNLTKKEKKSLEKICRNARKNRDVYMIEKITGISKVMYMIRKIFGIKSIKGLPDGKY